MWVKKDNLSFDIEPGGDLEARLRSEGFTEVAETVEDPSPETASAPNLADLTKADLFALAADRGVTVDAGATKAQIIDALEAGEQSQGSTE